MPVLYESILTRRETCQLLNSIDQTSFFDYTPPDSFPYVGDGGGTTIIRINAWDKNSIYYPDLHYLLSDDFFTDFRPNFYVDTPPYVPWSIEGTFNLLNSYVVSSKSLIDPLQVAISVTEEFTFLSGDKTWPEDLPSLAQAIDNSDCQSGTSPQLILEGEKALLALTESQWGDLYREGSRYFNISWNWVLPGEVYAACGDPYSVTLKSFSPPGLHRNMHCSPEDGLIPIEGD
jgi:hypothetical protein